MTSTSVPTLGRDVDATAVRRLARSNAAAIAAMAAVALAILLLQSLLYGHLSGLDEYDDGAYFGASLQLLHGILPYGTSAFVQPPMLTVWFLPAAAVSLIASSAASFETARILTDVVAVANVVMVGLLVRHRPTLQVLVSAGAMAAFPGTIRSAQTVFIEPLLVCLCLAGLLLLFDRGELSTSPWRMYSGGALFGVAGATKLWAIFPFLAVLVAAWTLGPRVCLRLIAAGLAGFIVCCLPFFLAAPNAFIHDVFVTQAIRTGGGGYSSLERVADLTGLPSLYSAASSATTGGVVLIAAVLGALLAACVLAFAVSPRRRLVPLERFVLAAAVLTGAGLFVAPEYYYHYGGFEAPFIALLYGIVVNRLRESASSIRRSAVKAVGVAVTVTIPSVLFCAMVLHRVETITSAPPATQVAEVVGDAIPARGCVLYTDPAVGILANRFTADTRGCSRIVDYLGEERVLANGADQSRSDRDAAALQAKLLAAVRTSVALVISSDPAWGRSVAGYARTHFHLVRGRTDGLEVYVRDPS
jgi:4-amino-4-deoxy-L-arabinose transferase-like glycosyltransferase